MPIRPEWRAFYASKLWRFEIRPRILRRAGGQFDEKGRYLGGAKCEECGVPDRKIATRGPESSWKIGAHWWSPHGLPPSKWLRIRSVAVVLTIAHLNHDHSDNRDDNLKALCQWCHLNYDKPHHKETREIHKDQKRPLLAAVEARV